MVSFPIFLQGNLRVTSNEQNSNFLAVKLGNMLLMGQLVV
jgi:hypothetical protein